MPSGVSAVGHGTQKSFEPTVFFSFIATSDSANDEIENLESADIIFTESGNGRLNKQDSYEVPEPILGSTIRKYIKLPGRSIPVDFYAHIPRLLCMIGRHIHAFPHPDCRPLFIGCCPKRIVRRQTQRQKSRRT